MVGRLLRQLDVPQRAVLDNRAPVPRGPDAQSAGGTAICDGAPAVGPIGLPVLAPARIAVPEEVCVNVPQTRLAKQVLPGEPVKAMTPTRRTPFSGPVGISDSKFLEQQVRLALYLLEWQKVARSSRMVAFDPSSGPQSRGVSVLTANPARVNHGATLPSPIRDMSHSGMNGTIGSREGRSPLFALPSAGTWLRPLPVTPQFTSLTSWSSGVSATRYQ